MIRIWIFVFFIAATVTAQESSSGCISCHEDEAKKIKSQAHGLLACEACHKQHEEYPHPENVPKPACASCHSKVVKDYARGVHAAAASKGNALAPDCAACHGKAHEMQSTKTASFRSAVPELCGACHSEVAEQYNASVHGQAVAHGVLQAAVCTDCHGEHSILAPGNMSSSVHASHIADTCGGCHGNVRLTRQFGLPSDRVVSFEASFHGLAAKAGSETVANCSSCHGVHNIRPSSDPLSTINPKNLASTCGKCHAGAGQRFVLGPVHVVPGEQEPPAVRWVRNFYFLVIPLTVGFMLLHNFGDWIQKLRRLRFSSTAGSGGGLLDAEKQELRMLPFERIEHAILVVSFVVLAWTGFALRYSDQWWARPVLLWEASRSTRAGVHRIASVVFMSGCLAHICSLIFSKQLRLHWRSLWLGMQDAREAIANFAYNMGLRRHVPGRSPHSYVEKIEYWALVWGAVVMAGSGITLWANSWVLRRLPKVVLDVAASIHFYEAVLATLAIAVWHFYFVIFDPDVYPMDMAWLTGKSPRTGPAHEQATTESGSLKKTEEDSGQ